jgi:hypothetical protein
MFGQYASRFYFDITEGDTRPMGIMTYDAGNYFFRGNFLD